MGRKKSHTFNYYFLQKQIKINQYQGFRQVIINLLTNKNQTKNKNKFLFVQEKGGSWGFSRQSVLFQDLVENLFETLVRNLGEEFGFKGPLVKTTRPTFFPQAYLFNIEKQVYDSVRAKDEARKKRSTKGKIYHLVLMSYKGPDDLPIDSSSVIRDYRWVNAKEGQKLKKQNYDLLKTNQTYSKSTMDFHQAFYEKIIDIYNHIQNFYLKGNLYQRTLF
jgi:hypothetical protein